MGKTKGNRAACSLSRKACALLAAVILNIPAAWSAALHAAALFGSQSSQAQTAQKNSGFQEFSRNVELYEQLRKQLESKLPSSKSTDDPQSILARERVLAARIVEARSSAKVGDIFADGASAAFRKEIQDAFSGPKGRELYKTIFQGEPLNVSLHVNQVYPASRPATTVPPTLLLLLPKLPQGLEYRIIGRDFALEDVKATLLIDFIRGVFPL